MSDATAQPAPTLDYAPAPRGSRWLKVWAVAKWFLLAIVLFYVAKALANNFRQVPWHSIHVNWLFVSFGMLSLLAARLSNGLNVRSLLAALGADLPARRVVPAIWVASLGRYVPGKMAAVAGAVVLLVRAGARAPVAVAGLFLSTALMMLMGVVISTPLLFTPALKEKFPLGPLVALLVIIVGVVCLSPKVFLALCNFAIRKLKRPPIADSIKLRNYFAAILLTFGRNAFLGLGLWFAARAMNSDLALRSYWFMLAAAGLASWIGFLAVFTTAGFGVHEAIYIWLLTPTLGPKVALLVVMFRLFHVAADAIVGGAGAAMLRTDRTTSLPSTTPAGA